MPTQPVPAPATEAEFAQLTLRHDNTVRQSRLRGFTTALRLSSCTQDGVIASAAIAVEVSHLSNRRRHNHASSMPQERGCMASYQFAVSTVSDRALSICPSYEPSCREAMVVMYFRGFAALDSPHIKGKGPARHFPLTKRFVETLQVLLRI